MCQIKIFNKINAKIILKTKKLNKWRYTFQTDYNMTFKGNLFKREFLLLLGGVKINNMRY